MSHIINITVAGNIATANPTQKIVCDNTKYKVIFHFDSSWDDMPVKTARFIYNDNVVDIPIDGTEVPIPRIVDATILSIGVYADNIQTSSPAIIECVQSILGKFGTPPAPTDDVYNTIIALINKMSMESGSKPYNGAPLANGEGSPGTRGEYARGDHVHPTDKTRASAETVESLRRDLLNKQDSLSFDGAYHPTGNKVATVDTVIREIAKIIAGAPEDFNTLKELSDWLSTHGTEAAKMNSDIEQNSRDILQVSTIAEAAKTTAEGISNIAGNALSFANRAMKDAEEVKDKVRDLENSIQDTLTFDGEYNPETNKVATVDTVIREVAKIISGAPEDFNTLKELADWLSTHGTEAAKMNSDIKDNANAIAAEKNRAEAEEKKIRGEIATPDYNENDSTKKSHIFNRPFYEDLSEKRDIFIAWDDAEKYARLTISCTPNDTHDGRACLVSDLVLTRDMLIGAKATRSCTYWPSDTSTITLTEDNIFEETENGIWIKVTTGLAVEAYIFIVYNTLYKPSCVDTSFPAPGVYFTEFYHYDNPYIKSLEIKKDGIKKIDNKFIDLKSHPDFIALRNELVSLATSLTNIINGG